MNSDPTAQEKQLIRRRAMAARRRQPAARQRSRQATARLSELLAYQKADSLLHYVSARSELVTHELVQAELAAGRCELLVPYCWGDELELFRLADWSELAVGAFGILEPRAELRPLPERRGEIGAVDLVVVPGVAFDRRGGRLGHGHGYYDRLLGRAASATVLVGLCFDCQLELAIPLRPHDVTMHWLVTESQVIDCRGDA